MSMGPPKLPRSRLVVGVAALAVLGLAGCSQPQQSGTVPTADAGAPPLALPLTTGTAVAARPAPTTDTLPATAPQPRRRLSRPTDAYGYVDQAYGLSSAIGKAPPDYTFDYEGTRPWVWRTETNALRVEEQTPEGDRAYYYEPGASDPYLVRDGSYAYAFSEGGLVAVYDARGHPLSQDETDRWADRAGRTFARARALHAAALERQRESVNAASWANRRSEADAQRRRWAETQQQSADWRAYHADHDAEQRAYWQDEAARRRQSAAAFDRWSGDGYRGNPPPPPPMTGPATAGVVGALISTLIGGQSGHDDRGPPRDDPAARQRAMDAARQEALQAQSLRQAQTAALDESLAQARRQQAEADAAHQAAALAQAQAQVQALEAQRRLQAQAEALHSQQLNQAAQNAALVARQAQAEAQARFRAQAEAARQAQFRQQQTDADVASRARLQAQSAQVAAQRAALQAEQASVLARQAQARAQVQAQMPSGAQAHAKTQAQAQAAPASGPPQDATGGAPHPHHGPGDGGRHRPDGAPDPGRPQP